MTTVTITGKSDGIKCKLHYRKIYTPINLPTLNQIFAQLKNVSILGGNSSKENSGLFSYWAAEPREIFEFHSGQKNPFEKLQGVLQKYLAPELICELPRGIFYGGWIGFFSYELGRYIEKLPETTIDDLEMPLIKLCFYDRVIAFDHIDKTCWLFALEIRGDNRKPEQKLDKLERLIAQSQKIKITPPSFVELEKNDFSNIQCNMDKSYYLQTVEKIKKYIYDGETYQINFSRRFETDFNAEAIDLFHWQNQYNPSPYAAYIDTGDFKIVSASPEMFITITDGFIQTKPIKGTRPRIKNPSEDYTRELFNNQKEQAELNMIIDLERNDVAKICIPGTRKVTQPRTIETYPTVLHAVATIGGQLRNDVTICDVLKAMFPGGSITGAPKIRSMEIIDETEPTARGVYTGGIGFIGIDGNACLNIAIRTIIIKDNMVYAQTGGGIVADSDAEAEWQETIVKARALLAGINNVIKVT